MTKMERVPLSAWQAVTLRLTTFHDSIDEATLEPLYRKTIGEEPENIVKRREGFQADGILKDGRMVLAVP